MKNQLVVRWTPGCTPETGITYEQYESGKWIPTDMDHIDKSMRCGIVVHWNPAE